LADPVVTVPNGRDVIEATQTAITGVSVADTDTDLSTIEVYCLYGTMDVSNLSSCTVAVGALDSSRFKLSGTQANLNTAIGTLRYTGLTGFNRYLVTAEVTKDIVTVIATDGAAGTDTETFTVDVHPTGSTLRWCSNSGDGAAGTSEAAPYSPMDFLEELETRVNASQSVAGYVGIGLDGRYTGTRYMLNGLSASPGDDTVGIEGTLAQPIVFKSQNPGGVEIDGENARKTCHIYNAKFFYLEGINAHDSSESVIYFTGSSSHRCPDCIVREVVAWNADRTGNFHVFSSWRADRHLRVDCAGFGSARKTFEHFFSSGGGDGPTDRRCWGRWEDKPNPTPNQGPQMSFSQTYGSDHQWLENCIGLIGGTSGQTEQRQGCFSHDTEEMDGLKQYGCITYVKDWNATRAFPQNGYFVLGKGQNEQDFQHNAIYLLPSEADLDSGGNPTITVRPMTLVANPPGGSSTNIAQNISIVAANDWSVGAGWTTGNQQYDDTAYTGIDSIFSATPGGGANIRYRYNEDHRNRGSAPELTNDNLWGTNGGWPMRDRIFDATALAIAAGNSPDGYDPWSDPDTGGGEADVDAAIAALWGTLPFNTAPVNTTGTPPTIEEEVAVALTGYSIADTDSNLKYVRVSVTGGTVSVTLSGCTVVAGANGSADLILSGTQANLNTAIGTLQYTSNNGVTADTLTMIAIDGNQATDINHVSLTIGAPATNEAPVNTVAISSFITLIGTLVAITGTSVTDADGNIDTVRYNCTSGDLGVTLSGSATISAGANNSSDLTVEGSETDINNTIATLTYTPDSGFQGTDTITMTSTDEDMASDVDSITVETAITSITKIKMHRRVFTYYRRG
jgi:hypothetical protein